MYKYTIAYEPFYQQLPQQQFDYFRPSQKKNHSHFIYVYILLIHNYRIVVRSLVITTVYVFQPQNVPRSAATDLVRF